MLTQSYYTPRMEYSSGTSYASTIYHPMTPPYTNGYDHHLSSHTEFLQHIGIKSTAYDHHATLSRYLDGSINQSIGRDIPTTHFYSNSSNSNSIRPQLPPTPPSLSTSPLLSSAAVPTTTAAVVGSNYYRFASNPTENVHQLQQYDNFSDCAFNHSNNNETADKIQKQTRKSVIMKIESEKHISSNMNENSNGGVVPVPARIISDAEEEFICKWEFCYK